MTTQNDPPGNFVVCNLQVTPKDRYASLLIHSKSDKILFTVVKSLKVKVEDFKWIKNLNITVTKQENSDNTVLHVKVFVTYSSKMMISNYTTNEIIER